MTSLYEKKIDSMLDKMFGNFDFELRNVMKLTLMNNKIPDEKIAFTNELIERNVEYAKCIDDEMENTLDENGNIVPATTPLFNFLKVIDNQPFEGTIRTGTPVEIENPDIVSLKITEDIKELTNEEKSLVKDLLYDI